MASPGILYVDIYDMIGNKVLNEREFPGPKGEIAVDVSMLSRGIYNVSVMTEKDRRIGQFVKR